MLNYLSNSIKLLTMSTSRAFIFFLFFIRSLSAHREPFLGRRLKSDSELLPSYDFVVIGGGTGGLAVANRLSINPSK
jgi:hypothetical protein